MGKGHFACARIFCLVQSKPKPFHRTLFHYPVTDLLNQLPGPAGHRNKILRTITEIKKQELEEDIPDEFLCPITREVMSDPVIAAGWCFTIAKKYKRTGLQLTYIAIHTFDTNFQDSTVQKKVENTVIVLYVALARQI